MRSAVRGKMTRKSSLGKCSVCGTSLKVENFPAHLQKVHPGVDSHAVPGIEGVRRRRAARARQDPARSRSRLIATLVVVVVAIAVYALLLHPLVFPGRNEPPADLGPIDVHLEATCGCCHQYMAYLEANGFQVTPNEMADVSGVKQAKGIPSNMWSCHTSILGSYFVEGHVPMEAIHTLMTENPSIDGIALPGMPSGSPGMGGSKTAPFVVYAISRSQVTVFMEI